MLRFKFLSLITFLTSALSVKELTVHSFCIHGVNYNPRIGPDWAPVDGRCKNTANIEADMATLAQVTRSVRLYGLGDCEQGSTVVHAATRAGLTVSLGLWVSSEDTVFESEYSKLEVLLQQNAALFSDGSIVDIHVGSEAIYRKDVTAAQNIDDLRRVKALLATHNLDSVPVTIADIGDVYLAHPELIDAVDFVQANSFPFWEQIAVENAVAYFESRMEPLYHLAAVQGKKVVIGETGWASDGTSPKASEASSLNAARYFYDFYQMAQQKDLQFYYFEGFDEEWKIDASNSTVEGYFGLFHQDRVLKTAIADLSLGSSCSVDAKESLMIATNSGDDAFISGPNHDNVTEIASTTSIGRAGCHTS